RAPLRQLTVTPVDSNKTEPGEDPLLSFDFRRYLEGLRKYVWAVIAIEALAITLAVIYTRRQIKIYQAVASVQIEPRVRDVLGGHADSPAASTGGLDYYMQQKELLGSYKIARQSVEQHRLYLTVLSDAERADRKLDDQIEDATRRVRGMV